MLKSKRRFNLLIITFLVTGFFAVWLSQSINKIEKKQLNSIATYPDEFEGYRPSTISPNPTYKLVTVTPYPTRIVNYVPPMFIDTSDWKTYTEQVPRYEGGCFDIPTTLKPAGYKKYTFSFPQSWKTEFTGEYLNVSDTKSTYTVKIRYESCRDFGVTEIARTNSGLPISTITGEAGTDLTILNSKEFLEKNLRYELYDLYFVQIEDSTGKSDLYRPEIFEVTIPITDKEGNILDVKNIYIGRAILYSFDSI